MPKDDKKQSVAFSLSPSQAGEITDRMQLHGFKFRHDYLIALMQFEKQMGLWADWQNNPGNPIFRLPPKQMIAAEDRPADAATYYAELKEQAAVSPPPPSKNYPTRKRSQQ